VLRRGRVRPPSAAPAEGERFDHLVARNGQPVVQQILSGKVESAAEYVQPRDEWVVVLAGGALLAVAGEAVELGPGDWVLLPADVPHGVVRVDPGTSWLAFYIDPT
jgi:cupin 2 domain-containing protein